MIAMERIGRNVTVETVKRLDDAGLIRRHLDHAPLKDTVTVPDGGFTIVRFHADNPGTYIRTLGWLFFATFAAKRILRKISPEVNKSHPNVHTYTVLNPLATFRNISSSNAVFCPPGYWLFHCHIEFHAEVGMSLIFKVGDNKDMLPVPHNFPSCGDWQPENAKHATESTSHSTKDMSEAAMDDITENNSVQRFVKLLTQVLETLRISSSTRTLIASYTLLYSCAFVTVVYASV